MRKTARMTRALKKPIGGSRTTVFAMLGTIKTMWLQARYLNYLGPYSVSSLSNSEFTPTNTRSAPIFFLVWDKAKRTSMVTITSNKYIHYWLEKPSYVEKALKMVGRRVAGDSTPKVTLFCS